MSDLSTHPHDAYFKAVFSNRRHAIAFFREHLPAALVKAIRWNTFKVVPGSFVESDLVEHRSDLLYTVSIGAHSLLLYLLFEHQSTVDPVWQVRSLAYSIEIWRGWCAEHPNKPTPLPIVLPFLLHQGPGAWKAPVAFEALFEIPPALGELLLPHVPKFRYALLDLTKANPALTVKSPAVRLALTLMKMVRQKRVKEFFDWVLKEHRAAPSAVPNSLLRTSIWYALHSAPYLDVEAVTRKLTAEPEIHTMIKSSLFKSMAECLALGKAEGEARGEARGDARGKLQLLQRLMDLEVSPTVDLNKLPVAKIEAQFRKLEKLYAKRFKRPS